VIFKVTDVAVDKTYIKQNWKL